MQVKNKKKLKNPRTLTQFHIRFVALICATFLVLSLSRTQADFSDSHVAWWQIQSVDTMKFSRDLAREKENDSVFQTTIDQQVKNIANTGATHVGIGTPYDDEFTPFLRRWVSAARKYNLRVWFRGNFAGWERWFGYDPITREEHTKKTREFIIKNKDLFVDGDLFTSCPECENGGPGDPRKTGDVQAYRNFLINDYQAVTQAFKEIHKNVQGNLYSMNGDVAKLVMDKETTSKLGGIVTIDHYVKSPDKLLSDIESYAKSSGGKVMLGEFGAPIPDIHGNLSEEEQAVYLNQTFQKLIQADSLIGLNYWVNEGGSTKLWENGKERKAVMTVRSYFIPNTAAGSIVDEIGSTIEKAVISSQFKRVSSGKNGKFQIPIINSETSLKISAEGYADLEIPINSEMKNMQVVMMHNNETILFKLQKFIRILLRIH